jgi:hypothetical protein
MINLQRQNSAGGWHEACQKMDGNVQTQMRNGGCRVNQSPGPRASIPAIVPEIAFCR